MAEAITGEGNAGSDDDATWRDLVCITVDLIWVLLRALGSTEPIGVLVDTIKAWTDEANSTRPPISTAAAPVVARAQPSANVAVNLEPAGTGKAIRDAVDDKHARVRSDLAGAVADKTQLDRAVLAASPETTAMLQVAIGKTDATIRHLAIVSTILATTPSGAPGALPAALASPSDSSPAIVAIPLPSTGVVIDQLPEVPSGQVVPASGCSVAADNPRQSPAVDPYAAR